MDNAALILSTLDAHVSRTVRLVLYGRAALQLGFTAAPPEVAESKDVDAIIPLSDLEVLSADESFWDAQEATNNELRPKGLYITHHFRADQVFLRRDWEQHLVSITRPPTRWLSLSRPATLDLILTKMMRSQQLEAGRTIRRQVETRPLAKPQADGEVLLKFCHGGWKSGGDHCYYYNTTCGQLYVSLKNYAERGVSNPYFA